jgi:hypothetical protein
LEKSSKGIEDKIVNQATIGDYKLFFIFSTNSSVTPTKLAISARVNRQVAKRFFTTPALYSSASSLRPYISPI